MIRTRASRINNTAWYNDQSLLLNRVFPSFIHDYANQRYYNTTDGETSFPIVSNRTTNAIQFDALGRMVWGPSQMCTRGQDLASGWSMGSDGTIVLSGNNAPNGVPSYNITWTTPSPTAGNAITAQAAIVGSPMTLSVYLKYVNHQWARVYLYSNTNAANGIIAYVDLINKTIGGNSSIGTGTSYIGGSVTDVGDGWVRVVISGNPNAVSATDLGIVLATAAGNNNATRVGNGAAIEAASVILEPFDASKPSAWRSEYNTSGSAWYGPRFDYNPATGERLGLLIESARTNEISLSTRLVPGNLTSNGATFSVGPTYLGGWQSVRVTGDGTSTWHGGFPGSVVPSANQVRSVSAIVAYVDSQFVQVLTSANYPLDSANAFINLDLINGTITRTGSAATFAFIRPLGNGVYHAGFTFTCSAAPAGGTGGIVGIITSGTSGRQETNTVTTSVDVIHYSNSPGTGFTSVIPTFSVAATRATDPISMATGSWLNTTKGTIYGQGTRLNGNATSTFVNIGDTGGANERNQLRVNGSVVSHVITSGGVVQNTAANPVSPIPTGSVKVAYKYIAGSQTLYGNGGVSAAPGNIPALPVTQSVIHIGQLNSAGEKMDGWIKEIRYYADNSASNAQIQALTT